MKSENETEGQPQVGSDAGLGSWTRTAPQDGYWWMYDREELPFGCVVLMHHDSARLWVYPPGHSPRLASSFRQPFWWTGELAKPSLPNDKTQQLGGGK